MDEQVLLNIGLCHSLVDTVMGAKTMLSMYDRNCKWVTSHTDVVPNFNVLPFIGAYTIVCHIQSM